MVIMSRIEHAFREAFQTEMSIDNTLLVTNEKWNSGIEMFCLIYRV